ncbi:DUF5916 domain-containing protein [Flavobacterium sp.]|uniref:DUF5916 domain-containing protein n=1 Tax=Flavobacterium sp. TaxID=239 RepID=UPI0038CF49EA
MQKNKTYYILFIALISSLGYSQAPKKTLHTQFCNEKINVDGKLTEAIWAKADIAKDFLMINPDNGKTEPKERRTEVKVVYDNDAIYIGATLYDNEPSKIRKELASRDSDASADIFGVFINGYNDSQQEARFAVSAAGVQTDAMYTSNGNQDLSWNAIWDSHVEITNYGWVVEMKIPYAALRFSSEKKQTWGLNFYRDINRDRQQFTWNLIDNKINNESVQAGLLEGIENIDTPTRLFLIPYSSYYLSSNQQQTKGELKGGLDIKYGINDAFTLDAIMIPDFGQTVFDNVVLNLSPFEQQFAENRPFFTEGTDLFNKGNIFYSRRIGGGPSTYANLDTNEEFIKNPSNVNLLNALKISGRTKNGLGIGVLNAVTDKTFAEIQNTVTGDRRKELVEPLANYNVLVLDQRFRKNSSVSLVNTNVTRNGDFRDANVSALVYDLNTKANTYNLSGDLKYSYVNDSRALEIKKGHEMSLNFSETSGKYRYSVGTEYYSKNYDPNDLGINYQTHYHDFYANQSYRILNPTKTFNSFYIGLNEYVEFDNRTDRLQNASFSLNINTVNKKNDYYGYGFNFRPMKISDFYEPRSENEMKFILQPKYVNPWFYLSTNYNRKFAVDFNPAVAIVDGKERYNINASITPRYRFSDKLSLSYTFSYNYQNNNIGWAAFDSNSNTIFAKRNRTTFSNSLQGKYSVNNVMNFNLTVRHYWSYALSNEFYTLQDDGNLLENTSYSTNQDRYFNSWNLDLSYSWWFAPGSQISVLYRNSSTYYPGGDFSQDYGQNFKNLFRPESLNNTVSISFRYFIDYNRAKHWF